MLTCLKDSSSKQEALAFALYAPVSLLTAF